LIDGEIYIATGSWMITTTPLEYPDLETVATLKATMEDTFA